ncbi:AMP-binding protein [Pseudochelatococcus sp. B33]
MAPTASPFAAFAASALRAPDALFLTAPASAGLSYAPDGFRISYGELLAQVGELRTCYRAAGYGRGTRVALLLDNRPDFFAHWLALNALGASIVPLNPDLRADEMAFQLSLSRAQLVVAARERMDGMRGVELTQARLIEAGDAVPPAQVDTPDDGEPLDDDECALLFTSGSTGKPKGCILSNRYFIQLSEWYVTQGGIASLTPGEEVVLTPLPMFHMNALGCSAVGMMRIGGAVVPLDRFSARRWWASVADSGATVVHCLGVIPAILLELSVSPDERRHRVKFALAPGVDANHRAAFEARYGIPIVEAWSMTETGGAAVTSTAGEGNAFGPRCIGRPAPSMDYRLVDDAGMDMVPGQPGELLVRARGADPRQGFFSGYLDDPQATEEAWAGGWFHTGDVIYGDNKGLLYFFDRKKSIVRRSGENIAVLEVESVLNQLPDIETSAVAPVPDPLRGEEVFAFVVVAESAAQDIGLAQAILEQAAQTLAYHKLPGYVAFVDTLPLAATRKLARGVIKENAARAVEDGSAFDLRALKGGFRTR